MNKRAITGKIRKGWYVLRHEGVQGFSHLVIQYGVKIRNAQKLAKSMGVSIAKILRSNNLENYAPYDAEYQEDHNYSNFETDVKMLAFYLPQYHSFPENDVWWGKGFTEWTNVRHGEARFEGHYQPRVPHEDIGYYSLDDISVMEKQADLAKRHGIYGFCFYYYWFSGKRLMEKPVDMLLQHPEINIPFCLCWANENWNRTWDGQDKNVLISQKYTDHDDEVFMADMKKYIDDPRYIRIGGKPLVIVYNPGQIPDCRKSFQIWREKAIKLGLGEILIWTCQTANNTASILKIEDSIDAEVEFPPHNLWAESIAVRGLDLKGKSAFIYNYQRLVDYISASFRNIPAGKKPIHRCFMMAWDNAARRKNNWFTFYAFSLHALYLWVLEVIDYSRKHFAPEERFAFINAWNEWGEGTYLEPDAKYGYAYINTVSKALFGLTFLDDLKVLHGESPECSPKDLCTGSEAPRIAVQVHMFYLETLDETLDNLNSLPYPFDCYVTTDTEEKKTKVEAALQSRSKSNKNVVEIYENRGRDVAPFLMQMHGVLEKYDYICHIHSKMTKTNDYGNEWRKYNFKHLFGNEAYLKRLFRLFEEDDNLGIVFPETYPVLEYQAEWGGNREGTEHLLQLLHCVCELPEVPVFPVGNMFWARTAAVKRIFDADLRSADFPTESGQINATLAHQIERAWVYIAKAAGYTYAKVFNNCPATAQIPQKKRLGIYAHYDAGNKISDDDFETVRLFSALFRDLIFVTNSPLPEAELNKIRPLVRRIMKRENEGFDFGAWRDCLLELKLEKISDYDELILLNNSFFKPLYDVRQVFAAQEKRDVDFWGITVFPYSEDGSYIHRDCIPEHIQSYFMVFKKVVFQSDVFWSFWENMPKCEALLDVIVNCESQFTKHLSDAGFRYEPYIRETYYIHRFLNSSAIPYEKPSSLLLLGDPLVKKKCYQFMSSEERVRLEYLTERLSEKAADS